MKSRNEIHKAATAFLKSLYDACDENIQVWSFRDKSFDVDGVLLSTETSGETTFNSYDAFARVAYTTTTTVIVITLQSSCAGLIEIR